MYSFRISFWIVPRSWRGSHALAFGHGDIHRQQDRGRGVDGHAGRDLVQRDLVEQRCHILQRGDRNAHLAHLAHRDRVIGVIADLGGQVEGHRKAGLALLQQVAVAPVGFFGGGVAGILAHGPEAAAVHGGLHAAGERVFARKAQLVHVINRRVFAFRRQQPGNGNPGGSFEFSFTLGEFF